MKESPEIKPLKGFEDLCFGASKEEAEGLFGKPQETQNLTEDILSGHSLVCHYWDFGFSLFFNSKKNQSFCNAEIDNRETILFGKKIFTLKEKEIVLLMEENGFESSDTEAHNWGEKRISFEKAGLDFYFENNKLVAVNIGMSETESHFYYFPN